MTPAEIRALSSTALEDFYASLSATALPVGTFRGQAWSRELPDLFMAAANRLWLGKRFYGADVVNRLRVGLWDWEKEMLEGDVTLAAGAVEIHYPQLGLIDYLKPVSPTLWLGRLTLGTSTVWFTLEAQR